VANPLGPIEIDCDAPPYAIVRACQRIGIRTPEDVRWARLSHFLTSSDRTHDWLQVQPWLALLGVGRPTDRTCACGEKLPGLERFTFVLSSGKQRDYFLGQCARCRCVYWEEA
jgi:hypothetical protein